MSAPKIEITAEAIIQLYKEFNIIIYREAYIVWNVDRCTHIHPAMILCLAAVGGETLRPKQHDFYDEDYVSWMARTLDVTTTWLQGFISGIRERGAESNHPSYREARLLGRTIWTAIAAEVQKGNLQSL